MRREYPSAPVVGVGAVVLDRDRVLLIRRGQEPLKGEWSLPGGVLELGETLEDGLRREVREETGIDVEPISLLEAFSSIVRADDERVRYHFVILDYLCRATGGTLACSSDACDARWVTRSELNSHGIYRLTPASARVIEKGFTLNADA